jgi:hypothetical protein
MTFEQIIEAFDNHEWLHFGDCVKHGGYERWRRNGKLVKYKSDPGRDYIPIKYGMYAYGRIKRSDTDLNLWHRESDCPLKQN